MADRKKPLTLFDIRALAIEALGSRASVVRDESQWAITVQAHEYDRCPVVFRGYTIADSKARARQWLNAMVEKKRKARR